LTSRPVWAFHYGDAPESFLDAAAKNQFGKRQSAQDARRHFFVQQSPFVAVKMRRRAILFNTSWI
jgi:hypothetical protein